MKPKKGLGQNFLMHASTAERIVKAAALPHSSRVLEIGPGKGLLTRALLSAGHSVTAIETDKELMPFLKEAFASDKKITLVHGDFRTFDLSSMKRPYHVVANIPYYITGEIIRLLLTARHKPASVTLLVQKEVAQRIARSKKESLLSLSVKAFGSPSLCFRVPRGSFVPAPKVDSAVLHISAITSPFKTTKEEERFFEVLHAGFAHKRKFLARNLESVGSQDAIVRVFEEHDLSLATRAEDVPLTVWKSLAKKI